MAKAKKTKKILAKNFRLKGFILIGAGLFFAVAGGYALKASYAASYYVNQTVCNSSASDGPIRIYNSRESQIAWQGKCYTLYNGNDDIRVDVEPGNISIRSYKIGEINQGYGPCHNSDNHASNPPDSYNDNGSRYRTWKVYDCPK